MKLKSAFGLMGLAVAMTVACGEAKPPAQTPPPAAPAATPAAAAPAPAAATSEFGVPECDDYMTKYVACVDSKVPEAARASLRQALDQTKSQWQQAASTPEGKNGLAMACKQMTETAKMSMQAYGCTF